MCEPLSIGIAIAAIGAVGAATTSGVSAGIDYLQTEDQNEMMADNLEAQYQAEVDMANQQFVLDQQQLQIETMEAREDASEADRDNLAELRRMKAKSEAAMAGLNISGGTSLRTLGAFEIMEADVENEGALNKERIEEQFYLGEDANQQKRVSLGDGAVAKHRAGWNPALQEHWANNVTGTVNAGIQGAASGFSLGHTSGRIMEHYKLI